MLKIGGMTTPSEWGPHLWKILHSYAERSGTYALQQDEARAWISFLRLTEGVLPCALCRAHYKVWRKAHPLEAFSGLRGESLKDAVRTWLWGLHEAVNVSREATSFPMEGLTQYRDSSTQENMITLVKLLEKGILHRQVNPMYVKDWRRAAMLLRKLISV